jgi:hypothetical protein
MFGYFGFRWELFRLERGMRQLGREGDARVAVAKSNNASAEEIHAIERDDAIEGFRFQDEIRQLHSRYICTQSAPLIIPRPDFKDETMWEKEGPNYIYLTEHGINHMRAAIRAERKARLEMFLMWVPGVVGILGTLIGLAAILTGKK